MKSISIKHKYGPTINRYKKTCNNEISRWLVPKKIAMDLKISRHGAQRILTKFEKHITLENLKKLVDHEEMMTDLKEY